MEIQEWGAFESTNTGDEYKVGANTNQSHSHSQQDDHRYHNQHFHHHNAYNRNFNVAPHRNNQYDRAQRRRGGGGYNRNNNNHNHNNYNEQSHAYYQPRRNKSSMQSRGGSRYRYQPKQAPTQHPPPQQSQNGTNANDASNNRFTRNKPRRQIADNLNFDLDDHDNHEPPRHHHHHHQRANRTRYYDEDDDQGTLDQSDNNRTQTPSIRRHQPRQLVELDTLSTRAKAMVMALLQGSYDCMVCQCVIGKKGRMFTCTHCYTLFHLSCINKWARVREQKDAESEERAVRSDSAIHSIRCPACNFVDNAFHFDEYHCYCAKIVFDHELRGAFAHHDYATIIPHSCGSLCGAKRGSHCPHPCASQCHPGPCEPCTLPSSRSAQCCCGKMEYALLCGETQSEPRVCQQTCAKLLSCGGHSCTQTCHPGDCAACELTSEQTCFCGRQTKVQPCGVTLYSCGAVCGKRLACGEHDCTLVCHQGSCSTCPRRLVTPTRCACGRNVFAEVVRKSCVDALPTCSEKCNRMLSCGQHLCSRPCHDSRCTLCLVPVPNKKCRCGATDKRLKCHDYEKRLQNFLTLCTSGTGHGETAHRELLLFGQDAWIQCNKKCKRVKSCGKHTCATVCCPGRTVRSFFEGHRCTLACGKKLECGLHECATNCHRGRCNPCGVTYRHGWRCACGYVFVEGPFQCGTKEIPTCPQPCAKVLPCGHPCSAKCHSRQCPPCNRLCSRPCPSHGRLVHNLPCHVESRFCGDPCHGKLSCGVHRCLRTCHAGACSSNEEDTEEKSENGSHRCGQVCGLELQCGHRCVQKCHAGSPCKADVCRQPISVKCRCGHNSELHYCHGRNESELKAVACAEHCQIMQRNQRFAQALHISVDAHINTTTNPDRIPFAASVLKRIVKWMQDDKSHTLIPKHDKKSVFSPKFVFWLESVFAAYIGDTSADCRLFASQFPDVIVLCAPKCEPVLNLKPMGGEQRFVVFSLMSHYHIRVEKRENSGKGKAASSYLEVSKSKLSRVPTLLLSAALLEYQLRGDELDTLESMPPNTMVVIDAALDVSSAVIHDRLLPWTGDYRMWRNVDNQVFIVFTDEKARNSALTELRRFNGRKGTEKDSLNANVAKKLKTKKQQKKKAEQPQQHQQNRNEANSGWITKGNPHAMPKYK